MMKLSEDQEPDINDVRSVLAARTRFLAKMLLALGDSTVIARQREAVAVGVGSDSGPCLTSHLEENL
jgi:hypothetical protein